MALVLALFAVRSGLAQPASDRPNAVVIFVDDMGYSDTSPYGGEIETPNI